MAETRPASGDAGRRVPLWLCGAASALAGTAPLWAGEAVWEGPGPVACFLALVGLIGVVLSEPFRAATSGRSPARIAHGTTRSEKAVFLLSLLLIARISWLAIEIALGGRSGLLAKLLVGLIVGVTSGGAVGLLVRQPSSAWGAWVRRAALGLAGAALLSLIVLFLTLTGPRDLPRYPEARTSPYRLPYGAGVRRLCVQGNRAIVSHRDWEEFAYDFAMPIGSDICAARAGTVVFVDAAHDGNGLGMPNNEVVIDHGDATFGSYLHFRKDGASVKVGDRVARGQPIAASGNVGLSMLPHLHFQVRDATHRILPVAFADVAGDGVPRMFGRYTSGNSGP